MLRLQPYKFKIIHLPRKNNIADPLSRLLKVDMAQQSEFSKMAEEHVRFVAINSTPKAMTTHEEERASSDDAELQQLRECVDTGRWTDCPDKLYAVISCELCVIGQLALRGSQIMMPHKLRPQALALAHEGQLGIVGTKQALRRPWGRLLFLTRFLLSENKVYTYIHTYIQTL